jgi:hypothetical protein
MSPATPGADHAVQGKGDTLAMRTAPEPRQCTILVRAGEPAMADDIRDQDCRDSPGSRHGASSCAMHNSTKPGRSPPPSVIGHGDAPRDLPPQPGSPPGPH